jgi:DNA polymerase-4
MPALCRDCFASLPASAPACGLCGGRVVAHPELFRLSIAHIDCDAFYASVEKRGRPELADRPVIVGGGVRGVVTAACYVARRYGVRSAMPMFKALKACPQAVVIRPDFAKYVAVGRDIRARMQMLTPAVQPLSIDEAVLDLSGTQAVHRGPPALVLARFAQAVEREVGVTVSVGLAANRLVAKIAAERDKPRGFVVIGAEAAGVLATDPVGVLPGVGPAMSRRLESLGISRLGQLQALDARQAQRLLGEDGPALCARARGEDSRRVDPTRDAKSISAETTFDVDLSRIEELERPLWRCAEKLARRLKEHELAAGGVTLKLKTSGFVLRTRAVRLPGSPTVLPDRLFEAARALLLREVNGTSFRLIGIGAHPLVPAVDADQGDLVDLATPRLAATQAAMDTIRERFGGAAIARGRGLPR